MRGMNVSGCCRSNTINWLVDTRASLLSLDVWRSMDGDERLEPSRSRMTTAAVKDSGIRDIGGHWWSAKESDHS